MSLRSFVDFDEQKQLKNENVHFRHLMTMKLFWEDNNEDMVAPSVGASLVRSDVNRLELRCE